MSRSDDGMDDPAPRDALDLEAAEYVMGTLPPAEAGALAARLPSEPDLAARVDAWERRLLPLAALVEPMQPPPALWHRLALATGTSEAAPRRAARILDNVRFWRGAAIASGMLAASLAAILLFRPPVEAGLAIAVLTDFAGPDPEYLVRLGPQGQGMVVVTGRSNLSQGRALELWALRPGATVPASLGLLPATGRAVLPLAVPPGTQLLVSQEPPGGSPTGLPTGPVVLRGTVTGL